MCFQLSLCGRDGCGCHRDCRRNNLRTPRGNTVCHTVRNTPANIRSRCRQRTSGRGKTRGYGSDKYRDGHPTNNGKLSRETHKRPNICLTNHHRCCADRTNLREDTDDDALCHGNACGGKYASATHHNTKSRLHQSEECRRDCANRALNASCYSCSDENAHLSEGWNIGNHHHKTHLQAHNKVLTHLHGRHLNVGKHWSEHHLECRKKHCPHVCHGRKCCHEHTIQSLSYTRSHALDSLLEGNHNSVDDCLDRGLNLPGIRGKAGKCFSKGLVKIIDILNHGIQIIPA